LAHNLNMRVCKLGDGNFYYLLIEEDNADKKIACVCGDKTTEYYAKEYECNGGITRLSYGNGSSVPYKNADGSLFKGWQEIK